MADPRLTEQASNLIHDIHIYRSGAGHFVCSIRLLHKTDRTENAVLEAQGFAHRLQRTMNLPDGLEGRRHYLGTMSSEASTPEPLFSYLVSSTNRCSSQKEMNEFAAGVLLKLAELTGVASSQLLSRVNPECDFEKNPEYLSKQTIAPYLETLSRQHLN